MVSNMDERLKPGSTREDDGPDVFVNRKSEQTENQALAQPAEVSDAGLDALCEEVSDARIEITRLQIEAFGRPRLFEELMEAVRSPEMHGIELALRLIDELPKEVLSRLFTEHIDEMVLREDLQQFLNGVYKLRKDIFPVPDELANIAYTSYALDQLARGLRALKATMEPSSMCISEQLIIDLERGAKRFNWPGPYGVAQWLGALANGYRPDPLSPVPGPA
jgi:hypothetical protein